MTEFSCLESFKAVVCLFFGALFGENMDPDLKKMILIMAGLFVAAAAFKVWVYPILLASI